MRNRNGAPSRAQPARCLIPVVVVAIAAVAFSAVAGETAAEASTSVSLWPPNGATGVAPEVAPAITFRKALPSKAVSFQLSAPRGAVAGRARYDAASHTATFTPAAALQGGVAYTATVDGGGGTAKTWSFTVADGGETGSGAAALDRGPGGPVLLVTDNAHPFSTYYAEILRNEGYDEFATVPLARVTPAMLSSYDAVILGEEPVNDDQVAMFAAWVDAGGNLIAMRPDAKLAPLLGLTPGGGTLSDAYLKVDTAHGPGVGITDQTIEFHGPADRYTLDGSTAVATLYSTADTRTSAPAVTMRDVGTRGGSAAAFTYDLARSVVETRQGNPAWAGQSRDGQQPIIRSDDLFMGVETPDWVDETKVAIPQADEQQRLLGNMLTEMTLDTAPLPHFWYLPNGKRAAIVMTGDDHANGGTVGRFDQLLAESKPGCSVANWDCLRMSSYIFPGTPISDAQAAQYTAEGFEIGVHVSASGSWQCKNFTPSSLESSYASMTGQLARQLPSIPTGTSERLHCVTWSDWDSVPKVEEANGVRLDTTYYYWPGSWVQNHPGMFTGSGMPMRFADADGTMLDVYQAPTQLNDEAGQTPTKNIDTLLDNALGPLGYYGVFTVNAHTDKPTSEEGDAVIKAAVERHVPVVSGRQMATWLDGRNASSFGSTTWDGTTLHFTVHQGVGANGLDALLPAHDSTGATITTVTEDGNPVPLTIETVKGIRYDRFAATTGAYTATYVTTIQATTPLPPPHRAPSTRRGQRASVRRSPTPVPARVATAARW
jgi:hypothetical protein